MTQIIHTLFAAWNTYIAVKLTSRKRIQRTADPGYGLVVRILTKPEPKTPHHLPFLDRRANTFTIEIAVARNSNTSSERRVSFEVLLRLKN
jgi:hypothetical protein